MAEDSAIPSVSETLRAQAREQAAKQNAKAYGDLSPARQRQATTGNTSR